MTSVSIDVHLDPSHLATRTFGRVVDALYVVVHADAVGSVIQLFKAVTSVVVAAQVELSHLAESTFGKFVEAEYADVQSVAEGSVIQFFIGVMSFAVEERTFGNDVDDP